MKVVALSGGVGGARFLRGLVDVVSPQDVTVVGNVGDDVEIWGLHVSPDLDSILYALAGLADDERGWGRAGETWEALATVTALGGESWFRLGDRDVGLHLVRTEALRRGEPLSAVTARLTHRLALEVTLLPATDDRLRTWLDTPAGSFPFQEWFVARGHRDEVDAVRYEGAAEARPAPGVVEALEGADVIVLAPSNPYVSLGPILAVAEIRAALERRRAPAVAVSPLVGGRAVRGPADRMLARLAGGTTAGPRRVLLRRSDRRTRARRERRGARLRSRCPPDRHANADGGRRRAPPRCRGRARGGGSNGMRVAIVGGTGKFGRPLAARLREGGYDVAIGSREAERAQEAAAELGVEGGANADVVRGADLVVLAVQSKAALDMARELADAIGETPLLCVASDLTFTGDGVLPGKGDRSLAEEVADAVRGPVAAGLHSLPAAHLAASEPPDDDVLVCGDDDGAKRLALELAAKLVRGRALDGGPLANARGLEGMTAVILNLNRRYGGAASVRITGLADG